MPELEGAWLGVLGFAVAEGEGFFAAGDPWEKAFGIRCAGAREGAEAVAHLARELAVVVGEGAPASIESAEPIPEVGRVPRAVVVAREIALKEPEV